MNMFSIFRMKTHLFAAPTVYRCVFILPSIEPPPIMIYPGIDPRELVHTWYTPMSHIVAISYNKSTHSKQPQNSLQRYQQYPSDYPIPICVRVLEEQVRILQEFYFFFCQFTIFAVV